MVIYETLNTNGNIEKWNCVFDDEARAVYSVGDIFLIWAAGDADREEKLFFEHVKRFGYTAGYDAPVYEESWDRSFIRDCVEREDMPGLFRAVYEVVQNNVISLVEQLEYGLIPELTKPEMHVESYVDESIINGEVIAEAYGRAYRINSGSVSWLDAFVLIDLQELLKRPDLHLHVCRHCYRVFIRTAKNQKYCQKCRDAKISEKTKQSSETRKLYRNISGKLRARVTPIPDNPFSIKSLLDFQVLNASYRDSNPSPADYLEWLRAVDAAISVRTEPKRYT